jgi:hypothetical protein
MLNDSRMPFHPYTVSAAAKPIHASGGMQIVPDFTFARITTPTSFSKGNFRRSL